jgi:phosphopantothenoylcysteine synthetase/decarboxylase
VALLRERGAQFIGPAEGELACGYEGLGRLETPDTITEAALQLLGIPS